MELDTSVQAAEFLSGWINGELNFSADFHCTELFLI